jgi:hypothetical protein
MEYYNLTGKAATRSSFHGDRFRPSRNIEVITPTV